ncbi:MAG: DUF4340 domain-containing protein [Gammaproteobacteria bacterium]|nr:DUF4340 domain-containing protein [Gammaproteobacteria bacterium]
MQSRKLIIFGIVTVAALAAAIMATRLRAPTGHVEKPLLFPDLRSRANDVAEISVQGHDRTITLARDSGKWVVREADGYPAVIERVRSTVIGVAELRHVADKTSNRKMFKRLGVEDLDVSGSNSILLQLKYTGGEVLAALIVGRNRRSTSRTEAPALYVRRPGSGNALLVEGKLDASTEIGKWLNRDLFDVAADRVRSVEIAHPDGSRVSLARDMKGADLVLAGVPPGKEPQSSVELSRMGTVLETFFLENARAAGNVTFPADAVTMTVHTFDGLIATLVSGRVDDKPMTRVSFAYEPPAEATHMTTADAGATAPPQGNAATEKTSGTAEPPAAGAPPVESPAPDVKGEVDRFNAAVQGWVFQVPQFKFDLLTRRMENLVRDPLPKGESPIKLPE